MPIEESLIKELKKVIPEININKDKDNFYILYTESKKKIMFHIKNEDDNTISIYLYGDRIIANYENECTTITFRKTSEKWQFSSYCVDKDDSRYELNVDNSKILKEKIEKAIKNANNFPDDKFKLNKK